MSTFEKVRDIVVDQLGVEADEVSIESTFIECGDAQSHDVLRGDGGIKQCFQPLHRGIGVGEGLKIGNVFSVLDLSCHPLFCRFQLGSNVRPAFGKLATTQRGAKNAATKGNAAVPVGAGKAAVQREFIYFAAEFFPVVSIGSAIHSAHLLAVITDIIEYNGRKSNSAISEKTGLTGWPSLLPLTVNHRTPKGSPE